MAVFRRKRRVKRPDGKMIVRQSAKWYVRCRDADGIVRTVPGYTDKEATKQLEAKLMKEAALASEGVFDRYKDHRTRPLREHLEDFRQSLLAKGNTTKHAELTYSRARAVIEGCRFARWGDISASKVQQFLAGLRNNGEGISAQTSNFYLAAVKQFLKWMMEDQRASESPLAHLKGLNVRSDRRHDRRALEVEEIRQLLDTTMVSKTRYGLTGRERAMLYKLAVEVALRANELRTLRVNSFDLDRCTITVRAGYSKHRREDVLPLRKDTVAELQAFLMGKMPTVVVFGKLTKRTSDMIRADLEDADIDYVDDVGRFRDFHALRHTAGTWLGANGVPVSVIRAIMRHSNLNLTSRYTHTLTGQETKAVESLPDLSLPPEQAQQGKCTGTDCEPVGPARSGGVDTQMDTRIDTYSFPRMSTECRECPNSIRGRGTYERAQPPTVQYLRSQQEPSVIA